MRKAGPQKESKRKLRVIGVDFSERESQKIRNSQVGLLSHQGSHRKGVMLKFRY